MTISESPRPDLPLTAGGAHRTRAKLLSSAIACLLTCGAASAQQQPAAQAGQQQTTITPAFRDADLSVIVEAVSQADLPQVAPVTLRAERIEQMLGLQLPVAEVERLLTALGLKVVSGAGQWQVEVPSHRFDLSIEVDLIEELARLYGYNRLPVRYPQARLAPQPQSSGQRRHEGGIAHELGSDDHFAPASVSIFR